MSSDTVGGMVREDGRTDEEAGQIRPNA